MSRMLDIHQHIVYGMDDGARTWEDALAMLAGAHSDGIAYIIATSHATPSMYPFNLDRYYRHLDKLNEYCCQKGLDVALYEGCEIFYSDVALRQLTAGKLPRLARSRFVLIEFDPSWKCSRILDALRSTANAGFIPVIAHVERYPSLWSDPALLLDAKAQFQFRVQMNAGTIIERGVRGARKFRNLLLENDTVDYIATDSHNITNRACNLSKAYRILLDTYGEARATALTWERQLEIFQ